MSDLPPSFDLAGVGTFTHVTSQWDGYYLGPTIPSGFLDAAIPFAVGNGPLEGRAAELAAEAINNFRTAGSASRSAVTPYLMRYYQSVREQFSDKECEDYDIPLDVNESNVWEHVRLPHPPTVEPSLDDRNGLMHTDVAYINFEGECTWEEEHGLQLVFLHGEQVIKVSPYDGHPTNAHASADPAMLDVIFRE